MRFGLCLAAGIAALWSGPAVAAEIELPPGPNRDLVYGNCRTCHDLQYVVESAGIPGDDWEATVDSMRMYGMQLPPDTRKKILAYLSTYLGPNPPKAPQAGTPAPPASVDGQAVFREQCSACHGPGGKGTGDQFPPLAGNADLFLDRAFPVLVVLNGLEGPVEVAGRRYNSAMPPFGHLSDATVAAVVNYVRSAWGNAALRPGGMAPVDAETVAKARADAMTPAAVQAYRADRKKAAVRR